MHAIHGFFVRIDERYVYLAFPHPHAMEIKEVQEH
jgi:hypothetical protein